MTRQSARTSHPHQPVGAGRGTAGYTGGVTPDAADDPAASAPTVPGTGLEWIDDSTLRQPRGSGRVAQLGAADESATGSWGAIVNLYPGDVNGGGGQADLLAGDGKTGKPGGLARVYGGYGDDATTGPGHVDLSGGAANGDGGAAGMTGGDGSTGHAGGDVNVIGGQGNGSTNAGGRGADLFAGGGSATGQGGNAEIYGGDAGTGTNTRGGDVLMRAGSKDGSGRAGQIILDSLPTADPHVAGAVWNSTGTLKISAG